MLNKLKGKAQGFTIIEVLIVLAIAGLILTIVFVAVPQLQRNTRDSKRQSIATRLSTELQNYASNNQGTFPFVNAGASFPGFNCETGASATNNCRDFYDRYVNGTVKVNITDPKTGTNAEIFSTTAAGAPGAANWNPTAGLTRVYIGAGMKCNGEAFATSSGAGTASKDFALLVGLERNNTWFCVDNG